MIHNRSLYCLVCIVWAPLLLVVYCWAIIHLGAQMYRRPNDVTQTAAPKRYGPHNPYKKINIL